MMSYYTNQQNNKRFNLFWSKIQFRSQNVGVFMSNHFATFNIKPITKYVKCYSWHQSQCNFVGQSFDFVPLMLNQSGFFLPPLRLIIGTSICYFSLLSYVYQLVAAIVVVEAQDNLFWSKKAPNCVHMIFTQSSFLFNFSFNLGRIPKCITNSISTRVRFDIILLYFCEGGIWLKKSSCHEFLPSCLHLRFVGSLNFLIFLLHTRM